MEEHFDFVVIGAGPAGEAATYMARARGASVAVIDRELFGGSCPFWACMPSKSLLHAAAVHAGGGDYDWNKASARRDYMINREGVDTPSDEGHVHGLEGAGATVIRGTGTIAGPGLVTVSTADAVRTLRARHIILAVGSSSKVPRIEGLDSITPWTNREATSTRVLPRSLVILGAGPTGVEMAQVFARYGVPTTLIASRARVNPQDHPRNSQHLESAFIAGPGASEAIHEAVLAIRTRTPIDVLADTLHAFPTTARVMGGLFVEAVRRLEAEARTPFGTPGAEPAGPAVPAVPALAGVGG